MTEQQAEELIDLVAIIQGETAMMAEVLWFVLGMLSASLGFFISCMVLWWIIYRGSGLS